MSLNGLSDIPSAQRPTFVLSPQILRLIGHPGECTNLAVQIPILPMLLRDHLLHPNTAERPEAPHFTSTLLNVCHLNASNSLNQNAGNTLEPMATRILSVTLRS